MPGIIIGLAVAAASAAGLIYLYVAYKKSGDAKIRRLKALVLWVLLFGVFGALCSFAMGMGPAILPMMDTSVFTMFFAIAGIMCLSFVRLLESGIYGDGPKSGVLKFCEIEILGYIIILLINYFSGMCFYFDGDSNLVAGPVYALVFILPLLAVALGILYSVRNKKPTKEPVKKNDEEILDCLDRLESAMDMGDLGEANRIIREMSAFDLSDDQKRIFSELKKTVTSTGR